MGLKRVLFVAATAICCSVKSDENCRFIVGMDEIVKKGLELCEIFQFEFIFAKPCDSIEYVIAETVDKFIRMSILSTQEV